jgi:hypothetical protein
VSGFDSDDDSDVDPTMQDAPRDDEVTLAPSDPPRTTRLPLWLIPVLLVVVAAVSVYFGWERIQGLVGALVPSERSVEERAEVPQRVDEPAGGPESEIGRGEADQRSAQAVPAVGETSDLDHGIAEEPEAPSTSGRGDAAVGGARGPTTVAATRIDDISWRQNGPGTEVMIFGNGVIDKQSVTVFPMRDPARILVRIRGIEEKYDRYQISVGSPQISGIRVGYHPEQTPPALYVVLDLEDPLVGIADFEVDGDAVRLQVEVQ